MLRWLVRARHWVQHPPPLSRVLLVLGVALACVALVAVERWVGWPEALTVERLRPPRP